MIRIFNGYAYPTNAHFTKKNKRDINTNSTSYLKWKSMLHRCYNLKQLERVPTYREVSVCPEWWDYLSFKEWYDLQPFENFLDKDILDIGNTLYHPASCLLVSKEVNNFFIGLSLENSAYLKGVCHYTNRFKKCWKAQVNINGTGQKSIGWFYSEIAAHSAWQNRKAEIGYELANKQTNVKVKEALIRFCDSLINASKQGKPSIFRKGK